jgi:hypothetical protein
MVASLLACLFLSTLTREAPAQATLMSGLGGPVGYGTDCLPPNDDGSWPADNTGLDLTPAFPTGLHFYAGSYTRGWINNNGNLSFQSAIPTFTPDAFPGAPQPMIAPYWADVDTRDATTCDASGYPGGGGFPIGATCQNPTTDGVWWSLTPGQMVITWDHVGFFSCNTTPVMTFQMILTSAGCATMAPDGGVSGIDFDIEFRYANCGWEAGDASGGSAGFCAPGSVASGDCTPAQAGFDSAEMPDNDYASLPVSRMAGISTELCTQSNLTPPQPGVWKFSVRGGAIECPSAGQPCMTGKPGICAQGVQQCTATGATTCVPLTTPQPMQCNGLDNNCDGVVDPGPCPTGEVCEGAMCVPVCSEGFCPPGTTCYNNACVETDCVGVMCPSGQRCEGGKCVDACSGVTCPIGQVCRDGTCVDPCLGLNCGMGQVCQDGMCVPDCPCAACAAGKTCITSGAEKGACVDSACATMTCQAGFVCQMGTCVNACNGAVCPTGQVCQTGVCVPHAMAVDAGMGLMGPLDGGVGPGGGDGGTHAGTMDGGSSADGGTSAFGQGASKGCSCSTAVGARSPLLTSTSRAGLGLGLAVLLLARRRKRAEVRRVS